MTESSAITLHLSPDLIHQLLVYQSTQQLGSPEEAVVQIVEKFLAQPSPDSRPTVPLISTLDYLNDPDDEPDEILYDFLPDDDDEEASDYRTYPASSGS